MTGTITDQERIATLEAQVAELLARMAPKPRARPEPLPVGARIPTEDVPLSAFLRAMREASGIRRQQDLAEMIDRSMSQVSRYENGTTEPDVAALTAIANACGLAFDIRRAFHVPGADGADPVPLSAEAREAVALLDGLDAEERATAATVLRRFVRGGA